MVASLLRGEAKAVKFWSFRVDGCLVDVCSCRWGFGSLSFLVHKMSTSRNSRKRPRIRNREEDVESNSDLWVRRRLFCITFNWVNLFDQRIQTRDYLIVLNQNLNMLCFIQAEDHLYLFKSDSSIYHLTSPPPFFFFWSNLLRMSRSEIKFFLKVEMPQIVWY